MKTTTSARTSEGFQDSSNTSISARQLLPPTIYHRQYPFIAHETHGIIVPVELADSHIRVYVHVQTDGIPDGARIAILLKAVDGTVNYASPPGTAAPPQVLSIEIPPMELARFAGKEVKITYIVDVDETPSIESPALFIRVTLPVVRPAIDVEGLVDSSIKASDYPHGLDVNVATITNADAPSILFFTWNVVIRINNEIIPLYRLSQSNTVTPGASYSFRIPKEAYTGMPAEANGACFAELDFAPHDPNFPVFAIGGYNFHFI